MSTASVMSPYEQYRSFVYSVLKVELAWGGKMPGDTLEECDASDQAMEAIIRCAFDQELCAKIPAREIFNTVFTEDIRANCIERQLAYEKWKAQESFPVSPAERLNARLRANPPEWAKTASCSVPR